MLDHLARTLRPGFCPGREELSRAAGLGGRGYRISKVLESLEQKGFLRLAPGCSRAITLLRRPDGRPFRFETVWVPMVGLIGASHPRQTATQTDNPFGDEAIELTRSLLRGQDASFALRVSGDSMVDALVNDGDIVILSATADVRSGDMVAARVIEDDGREATTLKYYFPRKRACAPPARQPDAPASAVLPSGTGGGLRQSRTDCAADGTSFGGCQGQGGPPRIDPIAREVERGSLLCLTPLNTPTGGHPS